MKSNKPVFCYQKGPPLERDCAKLSANYFQCKQVNVFSHRACQGGTKPIKTFGHTESESKPFGNFAY